MAVQLTFSVPAQGESVLAEEVRCLARTWGLRTGATVHADAAAVIAERHFAHWDGRQLDQAERRRIEAYFRGVLRRRILSGSDADAREARSRLVARSIEGDLIQAGWEKTAASRQAYATAGVAISA
ncbi:MAG: hypothetical protein RBS17_09735 [Coriobacteriia bacterium]|nr:hypothetical protein [Coriobacteriia bacterium]